MRILHVVDSLHAITGGPARSVTRLADEQSAAGHSVAIVSNNYRELGKNIMPQLAGVHLVPARRMPFRMGAWSPGLAREIRREAQSADIVHIHGLWLRTNHLGCHFAARLGKPYIVSPRGMLESWSRRHRSFRKKVVWHLREHSLLRSADAIHATAPAEADTIRQLLPYAKVVVAPNGIDLPGTIPPRSVIGDRFPAMGGRRIVLFLSRLHPKKGVGELLGSWKKLSEKFTEWLLVIAGDDYDGWLPRYKDMAKGLNIGHRVVFTGNLEGEEKLSILGASEVFVLPSHSENFGIVVAEALAAGKPVITTRATPWAEIEAAGCGWWIEAGEPSLTATLSSALSLQASDLAKMGDRGTDFVSERCSWKSASATLLDAYRDALEGMN